MATSAPHPPAAAPRPLAAAHYTWRRRGDGVARVPTEVPVADDDPLPLAAAEPLPPAAEGIRALPARVLQLEIVPEYDLPEGAPQPEGLSEETTVRAVVRVTAPAPATHFTAQLDLVVVVDVSGSMAGAKIATVKRTLNFIVETLTPADRLCLVSFSDEAHRLTPLLCASDANRAAFRAAIAGLKATFNTNILAGLESGMRTLELRRERNPVGAILLLTDGVDTSGVVDLPAQICARLRPLAVSPLIPTETPPPVPMPAPTLYTFGIGTDHDAEALARMATGGHGMFYYIETADRIPEAIGHCLGGVTSVYAQRIRLALVPGPSAAVQEVLSGWMVESDRAAVTIPDIFCDETKHVAVLLRLAPGSAGEVFAVDATYVVAGGGGDENAHAAVVVARAPSGVFVCPNPLVDQECNRIIAARALAEAGAVGARDAMAAAAVLNAATARIRGSRTVDTTVGALLLADLAAANAALQESDEGEGPQMMQSLALAHWSERSTHTSSAYVTPSQRRTQTSAMCKRRRSDEKE